MILLDLDMVSILMLCPNILTDGIQAFERSPSSSKSTDDISNMCEKRKGKGGSATHSDVEYFESLLIESGEQSCGFLNEALCFPVS